MAELVAGGGFPALEKMANGGHAGGMIPLRMTMLLGMCVCSLWGAGAHGQVMVSYMGNGPNLLMQNAPFQCERETKTSLRLQDGGTITREEHERVGRDAGGRLVDESFQPSTTGGLEHHFFVVADPSAKREISWSDLNKNAQSMWIRPTTHMEFVALPPDRSDRVYFPKDEVDVKKEDLGPRTIAGLRATGTRTTTTLPAGMMGNDKPVSESQEVWVADELGLVVEETDTSSIAGTREMKVLSVERTAPDASRFEVPADLTIRSFPMGPPPGGVLPGHPLTPAQK